MVNPKFSKNAQFNTNCTQMNDFSLFNVCLFVSKKVLMVGEKLNCEIGERQCVTSIQHKMYTNIYSPQFNTNCTQIRKRTQCFNKEKTTSIVHKNNTN